MKEDSTIVDPSQYTSPSNTLIIRTKGPSYALLLGEGRYVYFVAPRTGSYKMYYRNEEEGQNYTSHGELYNVTQGAMIEDFYLWESTFVYESYGYTYENCIEFTCNKGDVIRLGVCIGSWYSVNTYFYFTGFQTDSNSSSAYADVDDYSRPTYTTQEEIEKEVVFGESFEVLKPVREGYTFDGWYYNGKKVEDGEWNFDEDVTLEARWIPNS